MRLILPRPLVLFFASFACFAGTTLGLLAADPLTKQLEVDFGRDVASRNLKGLAARSDGRVLPGPVFTDLTGPKIADLLWVLRPTGNNRFLVGTGPDGKVFEVTFNPKDNSYTTREVADVSEAQVLALAPQPDGSFLLGTSPTAALYLVREGKVISRVPLPADSVFDFLSLPDGGVLVSTGNPGKIYRIDLKKLAQAGIIEGKIGDDKLLADKGVAVFGEVRDRNIRRLLRLPDGRIIAGSSPKGNVYAFTASGGTPTLLQENRDAEVVDLLAMEDGGFYAALVHSPGEGNRLIRPKAVTDEKEKDKDEAEARPAFTGRSTVQRFPVDGFPEAVMSRTGISFYRLVQRQGWLLLTAGEQGDTFGYDPMARRSLIYPGSDSAELNDLAPLDADHFLVLRNNAPGLALLSFAPAEKRTLETKRLDLGSPATLGLIRLGEVHHVELSTLKLEARTNLGSDEIEGWTPWIELAPKDEAYSAEALRGRYLKLRLTVPATAKEFDIDKASISYQGQNHRPQLTDFRIFPPNLALMPLPEAPARPPSSTLGQMLSPTPLKDDSDDKRKGTILGSPVIPQEGSQIIYWTVTDSDGDNLTYSLSIRPENSETWTDLAVGIREPFVQFDLSAFAEGAYHTRLTVQEQAPRPEKQRLTYKFETDTLTIDRTPPVITAATAERRDDHLIITVDGQDKASLLEGVEFILNNGVREELEHPADGLLDGKSERFIAEFTAQKAAGATSVEIILYDQSGNRTSKRLQLK